MTALSAEIVGGALPVNRLAARNLRRHAHLSHAPTRPEHGGAYSVTILVSATMLSRIGPVKPFLLKDLSTHARAGRTNKAATRAGNRSRSAACAAA